MKCPDWYSTDNVIPYYIIGNPHFQVGHLFLFKAENVVMLTGNKILCSFSIQSTLGFKNFGMIYTLGLNQSTKLCISGFLLDFLALMHFQEIITWFDATQPEVLFFFSKYVGRCSWEQACTIIS